jgi:hypothetical protein
MNDRKFFHRLTERRAGYRALAFLAALAGLALVWSCNNVDPQDHFDLQVDSAWAHCDSLMVLLLDDKGETLDTLFNDTVSALDKLASLSAGKYPGGKAKVRIVGRKGGNPCVDQSRSFDDAGGPVRIDTAVLAGSPPKSVAINPFTLEISVGDPDADIVASIKPAFADQIFAWTVEDASIATLDFPNGPGSGKVKVVPQKNGTVILRARAKQDTSLFAELVVKVGSVSGRSIFLAPDTLRMFLGAPDTAIIAHISPESSGVDIVWTSVDSKIAAVDSRGAVSAKGEGSTSIKARFGDATSATEVRVKRDIPVLVVGSKSGAAVNALIAFSPKVTQEFGSIVMFKWDLQGDEVWDDSLPGPFLGKSVDLPGQTAKYSKQGQATALFMVRDSEGNEATVTVHLEIGDQPPEVLSISNDTLISIKDSVPLVAKVRDAEGRVAWVGWDFESDGKFDDSLKTDDSSVTFKSGFRYRKAGLFSAMLRAVDDNGKVRLDSVRIKVLLDPPVADAGKDTSVFAGTAVNFHAYGKDSLGSIAKRELKVGAGSFFVLGKQDTAFRLAQDSGNVVCVVRVTDDDGNSDEDSMVVTIVAPDKSNNQLAGLVPSSGTLAPVFKPVSLNYSLAVANSDSLVSLTATTFDPAATLAINGKPVPNGMPSDTLAVKDGTTPDAFRIVVTPQDGVQRTYNVSVTRALSSDSRLAKLEPAPAFSPTVLDYADTVGFSTGSVVIKATAKHPAAKVIVNDTLTLSGSATKPLPLDAGDNLFRVTVTAQDNKTKTTYNVKVVRKTKLILNRIAGGGTVSRTDSLELPPGITATIASPDTLGFHFVKWVITSGTATLADSSANPASLTLKSGPVRVLAVWAINNYAVTTSVAGFAGGVFLPETALVPHGKDTTITITPLVGYRVLALKDNGAAAAHTGDASGLGSRTYKLVNVTEKHKLEATFLKLYTLTASVAGNGTITPLGAIQVDSGSSREFAMASLSPATGVYLSSLMDNTVDSVASVTGDPMNASKYALKEIKEDHLIAATFSPKTFKLTVLGSNICVRPSCTGAFCIVRRCLVGIDSTTVTVGYNEPWIISTADSSGSFSFKRWSGAPTATGNPATVALTAGDARYQAIYLDIIFCPKCVLDPRPIPGPIEPGPVLLETVPNRSGLAAPVTSVPLRE